MSQEISLSQIFFLFLKVGLTGFGGPVALISLMEKELTTRRWVTIERFNEAYVICKLLPGPVAYQMALWNGHYLRGKWGGITAGIGFLIPGFLLVLLFSIFYGSLSQFAWMEPVLSGMRAGAIAVIADSVFRMFQPYARKMTSYVYVGLASVLMFYFPNFEPFIVLSGGLAFVLYQKRAKFLGLFPITLLQLYWVHFKAGSFVFGTGLAIVPFLEYDTVRVHGWLTHSEFLDGIAFGQVTPGPVTITSAFIGYKAAGTFGSIAAMLGMYSPGLLFILFLVPWMQRKVSEAGLRSFQEGAIPMVIGCIVGASILLGVTTITAPSHFITFTILFTLMVLTSIPGFVVILLGSLANLLWTIVSGS